LSNGLDKAVVKVQASDPDRATVMVSAYPLI